MRYLIYILLIGSLFGQDVIEPKTYTFTEAEVLGFTNTIKELELKDSLNVSLVEDLESQLQLFEENSVIDSIFFACVIALSGQIVGIALIMGSTSLILSRLISTNL